MVKHNVCIILRLLFKQIKFIVNRWRTLEAVDKFVHQVFVNLWAIALLGPLEAVVEQKPNCDAENKKDKKRD